jgi:RNA-directed DNA polymerase
VIDLDLRSYFDNVSHDLLLVKVARRVQDGEVLHLLKLILKASGTKGVPQGGVISPLLSNLYLNEVDRMLERAKEVTRNGPYTRVEYVRYADDMIVLVDGKYCRHEWLMAAIQKRLREEFAQLKVELNEDKSRVVDLASPDASVGFLGFDFRRLQSLKGKWRPNRTPQRKKRTALIRKLKEVFRFHRSQPVQGIVNEINPILQGWVNYFRIGNSAKCFSHVRHWVERKIVKHMARARKRRGSGWKGWSTRRLHADLGLFNDYQIRYWQPPAKASPTG